MVGMLATSKAGHDKNKIYLILKENDEYVWLSDGDYRKIDNCKKKKNKHIQLVKKCNHKEIQDMINNHIITDEIIKKYIKLYCNSR